MAPGFRVLPARDRMSREWFRSALIAASLLASSIAAAAPEQLASAPVVLREASETAGYDGVVEAMRQTVVAAQVSGAVVAITVRPGDTVQEGQVVARIDARAAEQTAAAGDAQVQAARASLEVATREVERQRQLYEKRYISQGALERAEAQYKATRAQLSAQLAQAGAARTQSSFYVVKAPYAGVVSEVPAVLGDMAMPGRPLLTVYDPGALRVTASVPETAILRMDADRAARIQLPSLPPARQWIAPARVEVLPTVDAGTHTVQVRLELPAGTPGVTPGMFARAWLPTAGEKRARLYVPAAAVVRRAEMTGLYVIDPNGRPVLRQVRVGGNAGDAVEILTGVTAGERVALDPQAAARVRWGAP